MKKRRSRHARIRAWRTSNFVEVRELDLIRLLAGLERSTQAPLVRKSGVHIGLPYKFPSS